MDGLTFTERVIGHVVWPVAILAMALAFRHQLREVLLRISRVKFRGADVTFVREKQELEIVRRSLPRLDVEIPFPVDKVALNQALEKPGSTDLVEPMAADALSEPVGSTLSPLSPRAIVDEAWHHVVVSLRDLESRADLPASRSVKGLLSSLLDHEILNTKLGQAVRRLHTTRNRLVRTHGPLDQSLARSFADTADRLQLALQNVAV